MNKSIVIISLIISFAHQLAASTVHIEFAGKRSTEEVQPQDDWERIANIVFREHGPGTFYPLVPAGNPISPDDLREPFNIAEGVTPIIVFRKKKCG